MRGQDQSREIFLDTDGNDKAHMEFGSLLAKLSIHYAPADVVESMLVERIAVTQWRLARVLRYELRETRRATKIVGKQLPEYGQEPTNYAFLFNLIREDPEQAYTLLDKAVSTLTMCIEHTEKGGELDTVFLDQLKSIPGGIYTRLLPLLENLKGSSFTLEDLVCGSRGGVESQVPLLFCEELKNLMRWSDVCEMVLRNPALRAQLRRPDLPDQPAVDRSLRYEAHLERQFYRAMEQLERVQRRRQGEAVPPPVNARVALDI